MNKYKLIMSDITVLKVDKTKLLSEYLWLLLNTYQRGNIFYSICTNWNNQSGIGIELLKSLKIPVPNLDEQKEVVNKFNLALSANKKKETKAQKLLDGIDEYLLNELGIKLPEQDNSLKSRVFITNFSEVSGGRLDAYYYQEVFKNILIRLKQSRYDLVSLRQIINDVTNGVEIRTYSETGIRYLRVTDLSKIGVVNHNRRFVDIEDIPQKIKLRKEDFLISRSGSLGLVNIVTDELSNSILSSHIFRVNLILNFVSPLYLQEYLRSYVGQSQFFMRNNGGVIPEINQGALKSIKIILPPLSKQEEIANHISKIREQAKKLQKEAVAVLENAKVEIEKIIMSN